MCRMSAIAGTQIVIWSPESLACDEFENQRRYSSASIDGRSRSSTRGQMCSLSDIGSLSQKLVRWRPSEIGEVSGLAPGFHASVAMLLQPLLLVLVVGAPPSPPAATGPLGPASAVVYAAGAAAPRVSNGQQPETREPPTPPHTGIGALLRGLAGDVRHLPSWPNASLAAAGGGLALAVHPLDERVNIRLRGPNHAARAAFAPGKFVGYTPVQMGAAVAVFATGRLRHEDKVSHFGMDLLRAQIMTTALTTGLKYAVQRERPDGSNSHSFPSGHASMTFATATVIERHLGWRASALGYTVASYVAASRLHDNRHYLSDVVFGAAIGAIGGRTVTQHGRQTWTLVPAPVDGGVAVVAMRMR